MGTVNGLKREALAALEDAVGDGEVDKSAIGLRAQLDASGTADLGLRFQRSIQHAAQLPAAGHIAVGDIDVVAERL